MKKMVKKRVRLLFFLALLISFHVGYGACQDQDEDYGSAEGKDPSDLTTSDKDATIRIPPGMELRQIGTAKVIVPKGTQVRKERSQMFLEDPDEYMARNLEELRNRIQSLEDRQSSIEKSLEDLKKSQ